LFSGRVHHLERCAHCGLVFERNPGNTWAFTIIGDRLRAALFAARVLAGPRRSHSVGMLNSARDAEVEAAW
jgi:hypothetical protein